MKSDFFDFVEIYRFFLVLDGKIWKRGSDFAYTAEGDEDIISVFEPAPNPTDEAEKIWAHIAPYIQERLK